jgi:oligopeptide transport system substrate-binding protein
LQIELEQPTNYFLQLLAASGQPIPRHAIEKYGDSWAEPSNIVTNGPFMLESWREGKELVLRRSANYCGDFAGNLDTVKLIQEQDPGSLMNLYSNDSLDILLCWFIQQSEKWISSPEFVSDIRILSRFATSFASFDVSRPPFDDPRVRRAFVMALDRRDLSKMTMMGNSLPATGGLVPPGMPGHAAGIALPHNIEEARRLLSEAGYPNGEGFPRIIGLSSRFILSHEPAGYSWKSGLGIDMDCRCWFEPGELDEQFQRERPHIVFINIYASYPDPSDFLTELVSAGWQNELYWENDRFDVLLHRARITSDQSERMTLFQQAEELLVEEAPVLPLVYMQTPVFVKPWVRNYLSESTALLYEQWKNVILEPH